MGAAFKAILSAKGGLPVLSSARALSGANFNPLPSSLLHLYTTPALIARASQAQWPTQYGERVAGGV